MKSHQILEYSGISDQLGIVDHAHDNAALNSSWIEVAMCYKQAKSASVSSRFRYLEFAINDKSLTRSCDSVRQL